MTNAKRMSIAMALLMVIALSGMPQSLLFGLESRAILYVEYTDSSISIEAHNVSLEAVLSAVAGQVGFRVTIDDEDTFPLIHLSLHNVSVEEVLEKLLVGIDYGMSYQASSAKPGYNIEQVFILGTRETENPHSSNVTAMGNLNPRSKESALSSQDSQSSSRGLSPHHQEIFNRWREHRNLREPLENDQIAPSQIDRNLAGQHQTEIETTRKVFDLSGHKSPVLDENEGEPSSFNRTRSFSDLEQDLESFHDVLMEINRELEEE